MNKLSATLVAKDYGFLSPLALGDVETGQFDLRIDRDTKRAIDRTLRDPNVMIGESSISRHVARLAAGDDTWSAVPFFLMSGFRHRCFFVRKDSGMSTFQDLIGKRVGTDNWMASGNTWGRAAMREQGVQPSQLKWVCGPVEGPPQDRPQGNLPKYAQIAPADRNLSSMMLDGDLDALMCPDVPAGFYESGSPFRRLFVDYRDIEEAYYARTGIWPGIHLTVIRRTLLQEQPGLARAVYEALDSSYQQWVQGRIYLNETPWMLEELEASARLVGNDWLENGIETTRHMVSSFCDESFEQGLVSTRVDPNRIFDDFTQAAKA